MVRRWISIRCRADESPSMTLSSARMEKSRVEPQESGQKVASKANSGVNLKEVPRSFSNTIEAISPPKYREMRPSVRRKGKGEEVSNWLCGKHRSFCQSAKPHLDALNKCCGTFL